MPGYIIEKTREKIGGSLAGKNIAVLGLAFKSGTSDARKSPGIKIANLLVEQGAVVTAYDPQANDEARDDLDSSIQCVEVCETAISTADIIFIATDWPDFAKLDFTKVKNPHLTLVDAVNMLDADTLPNSIQYIGVGR